jgi:hypothetical protein
MILGQLRVPRCNVNIHARRTPADPAEPRSRQGPEAAVGLAASPVRQGNRNTRVAETVRFITFYESLRPLEPAVPAGAHVLCWPAVPLG